MLKFSVDNLSEAIGDNENLRSKISLSDAAQLAERINELILEEILKNIPDGNYLKNLSRSSPDDCD